jgi:hypothetical protein
VEAFVKVDAMTTSLSVAVDAVTVTLQVASTVGFPASLPFQVRVENEAMVVTAVVATTLTVTRGAEATIAVPHATGTAVTFSSLMSIIAKGQQDVAGNLTGAGWSLALGTFRGINRNVRWSVTDGTNRLEVFADVNLADDQLHHLAGVLDRPNRRIRLFVDGEEQGNTIISTLAALTNSEPIRIGRSTSGNQFFGVLDEVRLSDVARIEFSPVLGEGDAVYRERLGIFERWLLPTPDALLNSINRLVQINGNPKSFVLIEKDRPGASASKLVRMLSATLPSGQSIDRNGNSRSQEEPVSGVPADDKDFKDIYLLRHNRPQVDYGTSDNNHRMQAVTQQSLDALLDLLARSGIAGNLSIDKSFDPGLDPGNTGLHRVGRALLLHHSTLPLDQLGVYAHRVGFDFVRNNGTQIYASVALGEKLEIAIDTLLAGSVNGIQTTIAVTPTVDFPTSPPFQIQIEQEVMVVNAVATTTWTVTRGAAGTATSHPDKTVVTLLDISDLDIQIGQRINLHLVPENLPRSGQIQWTKILCGAGRADFVAHPADASTLRTPITSRPQLQLLAKTPGEITLRVEYTLDRRTVTGTQTIRIGIKSLNDGATIAANGNTSMSEAEAVGRPEEGFNPIYLITHNVAGVNYGADPNNRKMQIVLEKPLNRLLDSLAGSVNGVQILKAFDPNDAGLHKDGRALRLQHSTISADRLGALAHQAGFGFVRRQGNVIYGSVAAGEKIEIAHASDLKPLEDELTVNQPVDLRARFTDLPLTLLFSIGVNFQTDLDNGILSNSLRQEFIIHEHSLSSTTTLSIQIAGNRWLLTDGRKSYTIRKENNQLNVYSPDPGYNWSIDKIGQGTGSFDSVLRPQVKFTPKEPGILALNITYLESDPQSRFPYTFEIRLSPALDLPGTIIAKDQYDLIMNILNYFHPIGVEVITQNIREHVVEVKGNLLNAFPGYTFPSFRI